MRSGIWESQLFFMKSGGRKINYEFETMQTPGNYKFLSDFLFFPLQVLPLNTFYESKKENIYLSFQVLQKLLVNSLGSSKDPSPQIQTLSATRTESD